MKSNNALGFASLIPVAAIALLLAGCASSGENASTNSTTGGAQASRRVKAPDGRNIETGKSSPAPDGGVNYRNPHMEKCWVADGFDFNGYDTLYIAPTLSTAKIHPKDEVQPQETAKESLVAELVRTIKSVALFANVVTNEAAIPAGAKVLKLENTITEYSKGGGGARFFAGAYGAGQPVLRVVGKLTASDKTSFTFEARRSGVSGGARMFGGYMRDEDVQIHDIRSLVLDVTDFMCVVAGKSPVNTKP